MQKKNHTFRSFMLLGLVLAPSIAHAQMVDYSGLEELFGEPVTTSATGQPQKISDAPVDMEIITADDIRRSGAENLPQIIGRIAGMSHWQQTRTESNIGVHGQNMSINPSLLVLVNGRQIYNDIYGFTQWNSIPVQMEEIKQIEVVKGPNAALFGFNAAIGVINIITYNPKYDKIREVGAKIGTDGYRKGHFVHTQDFSDKASVRFSGGWRGMQQYDHRTKNNITFGGLQEDPSFRGFELDSMFQLDNKTQLRLEANRSDNNGEVVSYYYPYKDDSRIYSLKANLSRSTSLGLMEASLYRNDYASSIDVFEFGNEVSVAQLRDTFRLGNNHLFRVDAEFRNNVSRSPNVYGPGAEIGTNVWSIGGMWNWNITPSLSLTNAARLDEFSLGRTGPRAENLLFPEGNREFDDTIDGFNFNSGLVWKATQRDSFRFGVSRGLQIPSHVPMTMWVNYYNLVLLNGNPHMQPTVVTNYDFGYDRKLSAIDGHFRSSLFYRKTRDAWSLYTSSYLIGSTPVFNSSNIGESNSFGADMKLDGKFADDWTWDVNYAFQETDDDFTRSYSQQFLNYEQTVPHHIVNAHLGWAKGPWEVDGFAQYGSRFKAMSFVFLNQYNIYDMDSYFTSGGRVAYTFDNDITLALSGVDISQARVASGPGLENERQLFLSISKKF